MALVGPLLMVLLFGVIEMGGLMKSHSSASHSAAMGARTAGIAGNDALADQSILASMSAETFGIPTDEMEYIIIWKALATGEAVPDACVNQVAGGAVNTSSRGVYDGGTSSAGACNVYVKPGLPGGALDMARGAAAQSAPYYFGCSGPSDAAAANKVDCKWAATNRKVAISPRDATGNPIYADFLGVAIGSTHHYYTGFFGTTKTITGSAVVLLEPRIYSVEDAN
ncbi:MAG: hypothetical protein EXQ71_00135 [Acidimicrobiia bacterium]|nr:hypothetical protein [Acidimicrobiia bacterium]